MNIFEALGECQRRWGAHGHVVVTESLSHYGDHVYESRCTGIHVAGGGPSTNGIGPVSEYIILASSISLPWEALIAEAAKTADKKIGEARAIADTRRRFRLAAAGDFDVPGNA